MALETGTFVQDLVASNPIGADDKSQGDDHIRLLKAILRNTFPNANKPFRVPETVRKVFTDSPYAMVSADDGRLIEVDATAGVVLLNLLPAATAGAGYGFKVVKSDVSANTVTLDPSGAETINGLATLVLRHRGAGVVVWSDGSKWLAVAPAVDINGLVVGTEIDYTNDAFVMWDACEGQNRRIPPSMIGVPIGSVVDFTGTAVPPRWLLCFGQAVSRTTYSTLFGIIGITYGPGDNVTTFNLPDLRGRSTLGKDDMGGVAALRLTGLSGGVDGLTLGAGGGEEAHVLTEDELAAHTHDYTRRGNVVIVQGGNDSANVWQNDSTQQTSTVGADVAHNNVQPSLILNKFIFAGV